MDLDLADMSRRADRVLAPGSQNYLRIADHGDFPRFFADARGARVKTMEGRWLDDLYLGSGAVILGHGDPAQVAEVRAGLAHGATVSLRHPVEIALAERLLSLVPLADRCMFFKTGSECAHLALRIALRATGRRTIVSVGYHGWLSPFDAGVFPGGDVQVIQASWAAGEALERVWEAGADLAVVIVSPNPAQTEGAYYRELQEAARERGGLFVMDEVKAAFRMAYPCLSVTEGLRPDLLLAAKAVSNGFPLAVLLGRDELLGDRGLFGIFSTFASENVSLFAARACLTRLETGAFEAFRDASTRLHDRLKEALPAFGAAVEGCPTFFRIALPDQISPQALALDLARRGVLFHPKDEVLVSAAHAEADAIPRISDTLLAGFAAVTGTGDAR